MSEKKKLNEQDLEKVSGGVKIGGSRIVECEVCKRQFDPDTVERGPDETNILENGGSIYPTYKCPFCNKFQRVIIIQVKREDLEIDSIGFR